MTPKEALEVIEDERYSLPILSDFDDAVLVVRQALNELEELKKDVARYFELESSSTRDGVFHYRFLQTSKLENETIQECETRLETEYGTLYEKITKGVAK